MKRDGPYQQGEGGSLYYLKKKKITLLSEGILIQPSSTYIPKLISLLKISGRRKRGLPYHSTLNHTALTMTMNPRDWLVRTQLFSDQHLV